MLYDVIIVFGAIYGVLLVLAGVVGLAVLAKRLWDLGGP